MALTVCFPLVASVIAESNSIVLCMVQLGDNPKKEFLRPVQAMFWSSAICFALVSLGGPCTVTVIFMFILTIFNINLFFIDVARLLYLGTLYQYYSSVIVSFAEHTKKVAAIVASFCVFGCLTALTSPLL